MHIRTFDRYEARESLIHGLDPRVKVVLAFLFILSNVLLPDAAWVAFLATWLFVLLSGLLAQLPPSFIVKRSFIALPFALAAVSILFTLPGETVASWRIGSWTAAISDRGALRFTGILIRSWLSIQMAILLTATTQFPDLMHALRHLRVPHLLVAIIGFMYRYLFVLADEAARLMRARAARSALPATGKGGGTLLWRAQVTGSMVGQLFLRSLDRSERVHNAMIARGYRGQLLTMNPHSMGKRDWLVAICALLLLAFIQALGYLL